MKDVFVKLNEVLKRIARLQDEGAVSRGTADALRGVLRSRIMEAIAEVESVLEKYRGVLKR